MILERTWFPSESRMHIPNPTLLVVVGKEASTLHLYLPLIGFFHLGLALILTLAELDPESRTVGFRETCLRFAFLDPSRRCLALSRMVEFESVT